MPPGTSDLGLGVVTDLCTYGGKSIITQVTNPKEDKGQLPGTGEKGLGKSEKENGWRAKVAVVMALGKTQL